MVSLGVEDDQLPLLRRVEAQHDLVAIDGVDVKVDGDARTACSSQPLQQRLYSVERSLRLEAVAHSGLSHEVARPSRIVFKLLSECLDVLT